MDQGEGKVCSNVPRSIQNAESFSSFKGSYDTYNFQILQTQDLYKLVYACLNSTFFISFNRRLASSVSRAPVCCARGRGFDQHSGSSDNWGERAAIVIISANG